MLSFLTDRFGQTPNKAAEEAVCVIRVCTLNRNIEGTISLKQNHTVQILG